MLPDRSHPVIDKARTIQSWPFSFGKGKVTGTGRPPVIKDRGRFSKSSGLSRWLYLTERSFP